MRLRQLIARNAGAILSSLNGRLTVAAVVVVMLSSVVVTAVALEIVYRDAIDATGRQQYNLLRSAASHLDAELISKRILLKVISEEINGTSRTDAPFEAILERHPSLRLSFSNVAILDAQGWIQADLITRPETPRQSYASREYFQQTLAARQGVMSQPMISGLSGQPIVLITQPIFDARGRITHILAGAINLADPAFFGQIKGLRAGTTGYLFALSRKGMILHHPDSARLTTNVTEEAGTVVRSTRAAMDGWEGWTLSKNKKGVPAILTYKQMDAPEWILGSVFPADEAFAGITKARRIAWIATFAIAFIAGIIGWAAIYRLLQPLRALRSHVEAVEFENASIKVLDLEGNDEVGALGRAFHSLSVKRELAERRLKALSQTDSLTGLGNRRRFEQEIDIAVERANAGRHALAIGFLDIDHFKDINDTHGHAAGDAVLREFAKRLKDSLRSTDQPFRLAGDEFVIIIERVESTGHAGRIAEKILQSIRLPFQHDGLEVRVTTSIGMIAARPPIAEVGDLLQHADMALYKAKRAGRNGYTVRELGPIAASSERGDADHALTPNLE